MSESVDKARTLIDQEVKADTRKLASYQDFRNATEVKGTAKAGSLKEFAEKRSAYLLSHPAIKNLPTELVPLISDATETKSKMEKNEQSGKKVKN